MKLLSLIFALVPFSIMLSSATEIVTIKAGSDAITWHEVEETDLIQVIGVITSHRLYFKLADGEELEAGGVYTQPYSGVVSGVSMVGVKSASSSRSSLVTLRISKQAEEVSFSPPIAVPISEVGDWKISLQVSTDMLNWFTAAPGVVPANSPAGFWRIKAEKVVATGE